VDEEPFLKLKLMMVVSFQAKKEGDPGEERDEVSRRVPWEFSGT
jgi:hypothetical protein